MEWATLKYERGDNIHVLYFNPDILRDALQNGSNKTDVTCLYMMTGYYQIPDKYNDTAQSDDVIAIEISHPENTIKSVKLYKVSSSGKFRMERLLYDSRCNHLRPIIHHDHDGYLSIIIGDKLVDRYNKYTEAKQVIDELKEIYREYNMPIITAQQLDDRRERMEDVMSDEIKVTEVKWHRFMTKKTGKYVSVYINVAGIKEVLRTTISKIKSIDVAGYKKIPLDVDNTTVDYRVMISFGENGNIDSIKVRNINKSYTMDEFVTVMYSELVDILTGETECMMGYALKADLDKIFMSDLTDDEINNESIDVYTISKFTSDNPDTSDSITFACNMYIRELEISSLYLYGDIDELLKERNDD